MVQVDGQPGQRPTMMQSASLVAALFLGGYMCCGPRYFGESGREVGYQPMGQQQPSASYSRELERRLSDPRQNR